MVTKTKQKIQNSWAELKDEALISAFKILSTKTYASSNDLVSIFVELKKRGLENQVIQKVICSVCQTPSTDGTFYCQTCGNEIK